MTEVKRSTVYLCIPRSHYRMASVDPDGTIRVDDDIAGHFTLHHGLDTSVCDWLRDAAAKVWAETHYAFGGALFTVQR